VAFVGDRFVIRTVTGSSECSRDLRRLRRERVCVGVVPVLHHREPEALRQWAADLRSDDHVAWEATGNSDAIANLLTPIVGRVVVSNDPQLGPNPAGVGSPSAADACAVTGRSDPGVTQTCDRGVQRKPRLSL
jgi:hypothetical protein